MIKHSQAQARARKVYLKYQKSRPSLPGLYSDLVSFDVLDIVSFRLHLYISDKCSLRMRLNHSGYHVFHIQLNQKY